MLTPATWTAVFCLSKKGGARPHEHCSEATRGKRILHPEGHIYCANCTELWIQMKLLPILLLEPRRDAGEI